MFKKYYILSVIVFVLISSAAFSEDILEKTVIKGEGSDISVEKQIIKAPSKDILPAQNISKPEEAAAPGEKRKPAFSCSSQSCGEDRWSGCYKNYSAACGLQGL